MCGRQKRREPSSSIVLSLGEPIQHGINTCETPPAHDRWFLDRVPTHMLAFEGDSAVCWFPGNYSEYEADRRRRLGAAADRPHRLTYRKLRRA